MEKIKLFEKSLKSSGFTKLTLEQKKKMFERLGLKFPDRVTTEHHLQRMYVCEHDGYRVVVNSGIIGNELLTPGLSWVMITEDYKRLFTRAFKSDTREPSQAMLDRILAYALVAKNIIFNRPLERRTSKLKRLVEKSETFTNKEGKEKRRLTDYWVCKHEVDDYVFKPTARVKYLEGISPQLKKVFLRKERELQRYYETRTAVRFRKEVRKTSKVTKPENQGVFGRHFKAALKDLPPRDSLGPGISKFW